MGRPGQKTHQRQQLERRTAANPPLDPKKGPNSVQRAAVQLYGRGFRRPDVARRLLEFLVPTWEDLEEHDALKKARSKLRTWEMQQWFRDELFKLAVIDTDLATQDIMKGVAKRAKEGNVDAAKFAMEVSGRYTPRGEATPPQVTVVFAGLPRPMRREIPPAIEGEAVEEQSEP